MPEYSVYVSYTVDDNVVVEASSADEALAIAESDERYQVFTNDGALVGWDAVEAMWKEKANAS